MKYPRCYCLCFDDDLQPLQECKCGHRKHKGLCLPENERCNCIYHRYCGNETSKIQGICDECVLLVGAIKYTISTDIDEECPICLEKNVFNVVLNCEHKVCHECWFSVVANSRRYNGNVIRRCPLCRDENNILKCRSCDAHLVQGTLCGICQFRISDFISNNGDGNIFIRDVDRRLKEQVIMVSSKLKNITNDKNMLEQQNCLLLEKIDALQRAANNSVPINNTTGNGRQKMTVGKYKGNTFECIRDNYAGYCQWVLNLDNVSGVMKSFKNYLINQ